MGRVALIGENSIEYINALLNIWNNGDCAVLLDCKIPFKIAVEMMNEAGVYKCYIDKQQLDDINILKLYNIDIVIFERKSNSAQSLPLSIYDKFKKNYSLNEAIILYSSGTTGKAKGIILSHFAINTNADAIINYIKPNLNDCLYIAKALSHCSTFTGELLVALKAHVRLVIAPTVVPPRYVLNNISKFKVSIICLNPTLLSMYAEEYKNKKYDLSSLQTIYVSGAILNENVYKLAHDAFENISIYNAYGLSEAGPRVAVQHAGCCNKNSVGKPIKGVDVVIVDESGKPVPNGVKGIIHVKTQSVFNGYVSGCKKHLSLYKGWLNTGDVGYYDEANELHIVDRIDDVIIVNSHKVYPQSIVNSIIKVNGVLDCSVFSIEDTSNSSPAIICFYTTDLQENISEIIRKTLLQFHPAYEVPNEFIRVSNIERNSHGKIQKLKLIEQYRFLKSKLLKEFKGEKQWKNYGS